MIVFYVKWILISLIPIAIWVGIHAGGAHTGAWWFSLVSVIGIVVTLVGGWIRRQTIRYVVSDRRIGIRTGIVSRNERTTHLNRVQNVSMRQGVIQRLMGIGDVDWDTAGTPRTTPISRSAASTIRPSSCIWSISTTHRALLS